MEAKRDCYEHGCDGRELEVDVEWVRDFPIRPALRSPTRAYVCRIRVCGSESERWHRGEKHVVRQEGEVQHGEAEGGGEGDEAFACANEAEFQ